MPQNPESGVPMQSMIAAIQTWNLATVKRLCGNDFDFQQLDDEGTSVLHRSLNHMIVHERKEEMLAVLKLMIDRGANVQQKVSADSITSMNVQSDEDDDDTKMSVDFAGKDSVAIVEEFHAGMLDRHDPDDEDWYQFIFSAFTFNYV